MNNEKVTGTDLLELFDMWSQSAHNQAQNAGSSEEDIRAKALLASAVHLYDRQEQLLEEILVTQKSILNILRSRT